jgi:hypothetical protein
MADAVVIAETSFTHLHRFAYAVVAKTAFTVGVCHARVPKIGERYLVVIAAKNWWLDDNRIAGADKIVTEVAVASSVLFTFGTKFAESTAVIWCHTDIGTIMVHRRWHLRNIRTLAYEIVAKVALAIRVLSARVTIKKKCPITTRVVRHLVVVSPDRWGTHSVVVAVGVVSDRGVFLVDIKHGPTGPDLHMPESACVTEVHTKVMVATAKAMVG